MQWLYGMFGFRADNLFRASIAVIATGLSLAFACGCDRGTAATSSPRAAAKAFVTAMNSGDADTIAAVSTGDDASLQLLVSLAKLNAAYARLEKVAAGKFGDPKSVFAYPRGKDHYATMAREIDTAPETIDGATATIGKGLSSIQLRKVNGEWKVDRARHAPAEGVSSAVAMSDALSKAYNDVADGIADASLPTAEEAKAVLMGKQQQAILTQGAVSAITQAASKPATAPVRR